MHASYCPFVRHSHYCLFVDETCHWQSILKTVNQPFPFVHVEETGWLLNIWAATPGGKIKICTLDQFAVRQTDTCSHVRMWRADDVLCLFYHLGRARRCEQWTKRKNKSRASGAFCCSKCFSKHFLSFGIIHMQEEQRDFSERWQLLTTRAVTLLNCGVQRESPAGSNIDVNITSQPAVQCGGKEAALQWSIHSSTGHKSCMVTWK